MTLVAQMHRNLWARLLSNGRLLFSSTQWTLFNFQLWICRYINNSLLTFSKDVSSLTELLLQLSDCITPMPYFLPKSLPNFDYFAAGPSSSTTLTSDSATVSSICSISNYMISSISFYFHHYHHHHHHHLCNA